MPITDLTGTKWLFNESLSITTNFQGYYFDIEGHASEDSELEFTQLYFVYDDNFKPDPAFTALAYPEGGYIWESGQGWVIPEFKTIYITGGNDATNSDLIAWLQANATQIEDEPTESNHISVGNLPIADMFFGSQQVKKVYLGNTLVWEITTEVALIEFEIYGTIYQAEEGMTWGEWVNSAYNTGGFKIVGQEINGPNGEPVLDNSTNVTTSDEIMAHRTYHSGGSND